MVQIKNNLAAFGHSKAFRLTETGFEWIGDYEITADEVLGGIAPKVNKLEQAKKSIEPIPLYAALFPPALFICPIKKIAHLYFSASKLNLFV